MYCTSYCTSKHLDRRRTSDGGRSRTQEADRGKRSRQNPFHYVGMLTVHGHSDLLPSTGAGERGE